MLEARCQELAESFHRQDLSPEYVVETMRDETLQECVDYLRSRAEGFLQGGTLTGETFYRIFMDEADRMSKL